MAISREKYEELAIDFFKRFACAEYSLKGGGLHKGFNRRADPNWKQLALSQAVTNILSIAGLNMRGNASLRKAVEFILNDPPRQQWIDGNGDLIYVIQAPPHGTPRAQVIIEYVKRVRNNLFHGGKVGSDWKDRNRNAKLIKHGITIMEACIRVAPTNISDRYDVAIHDF